MTTTSVESSSIGLRRPLHVPTVQNFHLVWLDESIDEDNNVGCRNSITKLREVVNTVNTFTDVDECIDFITDIEGGMAFMIVYETFSKILGPMIQEIYQVIAVYIYSENKTLYEKWTKQWPKVEGVYTKITPICEALKQAAQDCDRNAVSISFIKQSDRALNQNLDQLDSSFMYTQIPKEILHTIDFQQVHINEFLTYCRQQFTGNISQLKNLDKIEKEYFCHQPIWWYTSEYILYSMVNRALRLMDVDLIIKMEFFVRDLDNHITMLHVEQYGEYHNSYSFTMYCGQGLSQRDFDHLKNTQGGLLSFNNFLSTSLDRTVSFTVAEINQANREMIGVLFHITVDPSTPSTPFANIKNVSNFVEEEEILFSMHPIFRVGQVKQINNNDRLWQVDLTLTSDNDSQLHALTERKRKETIPEAKGWYRLGSLLVKLGQFDKAQQVCTIILDQTIDEGEQAGIYNMLGLVKTGQGNCTEAFEFYEIALEIAQKSLLTNHSDLAISYNNFGQMYYNMGEYSKALSYYEKVLDISQNS